MGSKVRGVRPIEFQRKISSLCWGGKSKNFTFKTLKEETPMKKKKKKNQGELPFYESEAEGN